MTTPTPVPSRKAARDLTTSDMIWCHMGLRYVLSVAVSPVSDLVIIGTATGNVYARPDTVFDVETFRH